MVFFAYLVSSQDSCMKISIYFNPHWIAIVSDLHLRKHKPQCSVLLNHAVGKWSSDENGQLSIPCVSCLCVLCPPALGFLWLDLCATPTGL
jgi:hypothetical protein